MRIFLEFSEWGISYPTSCNQPIKFWQHSAQCKQRSDGHVLNLWPEINHAKFAASGDSYIISCEHGYFCRVFFWWIGILCTILCTMWGEFMIYIVSLYKYIHKWRPISQIEQKKGVQKMQKNTKKTLKSKEYSEEFWVQNRK